MTVFAYARVSTADQTLDTQLDTLRRHGADQIFQEKVSGANRARPQLKAMLDALQSGDVVMVTRLDRFARSTIDMLTLAETITGKGAAFKSLAEPWADTTTPAGKMIVTVLAGIAEFERSLIVQRTSEGRERAKAKGVKFGRRPALTPKQQDEALKLARSHSNQYAADVMGVSVSTIERLKTKQRCDLPDSFRA